MSFLIVSTLNPGCSEFLINAYTLLEVCENLWVERNNPNLTLGELEDLDSRIGQTIEDGDYFFSERYGNSYQTYFQKDRFYFSGLDLQTIRYSLVCLQLLNQCVSEHLQDGVIVINHSEEAINAFNLAFNIFDVEQRGVLENVPLFPLPNEPKCGFRIVIKKEPLSPGELNCAEALLALHDPS